MNFNHDFSRLSPLVTKALPSDEADLRLEVLRLRDEVVGLRARLAEAEVVIKRLSEPDALKRSGRPSDHVEHLKLVVADFEKQLAEVKASSTWRVGRALLLPIRIFRRS